MITSFLLLQFIIIFLIDVKAQNPSESTEVMPPQDDSISNNFQPSLAVVIGMLSIMFALTFLLLLYAKFCHRPSSSSSSVYNTTSHQIQDGLHRSRSRASGLDKTLVESLPFFRFSSLKGSRDGLECSVCLAKRKLSADDLTCSTSLRFLWSQGEAREESNLELYVQREESRHGSSRFSIGSSFRKADRGSNKEEELPIQQGMDSDDEKSSRLSTDSTTRSTSSPTSSKHRWSNVSSSDLMFLNSEMLNDVSSARFSGLDEGIRDDDGIMNVKQEMGRKGSWRASTELVGSEASCVDVREERKRRLWLPIARKTVQWFANRDGRAPHSQESNLQNLNV
ncbi:E3 ubiquitin-protein ligase ATL42 [Sesamum angolense]|uniref:E3 ubiquitin-protein ligase ATL42 n=1 Tax=Sesamum angolense TaxID=2727404 RepID=A0AAE1T9E9_9LAMI|nr:E3 ubiquitin-protein ligase ATL42 [Sesamum angolense]